MRYTTLHEDLFTADTPQKMRAALELSSRRHTVILRCLDSARFQGFNGEDTMTFLAAQLALENERLHENLLRHLEMCLHQPIIFRPEDVR